MSRPKAFFIAAIGAGVIFAFSGSQQITEVSGVVNIEVPVRVFDGSRFIDDLTISDFEVYEDGKLQDVLAIYLIRKTSSEPRGGGFNRTAEKGTAAAAPDLSRTFILLFQVTDYLKRIDEALDYFFNTVLRPGDTVKAVTPLKTYNMNKGAIAESPRQDIKNTLKGILRKDIITAGSDYRSFCQQVESIADTEGLAGDLKHSMCMELLRKMKELNCIEEERLLEIAGQLKRTAGQKAVFIFYQQEALPIPSFIMSEPESLVQLKKDVSFDAERIKRAFSDSSIIINFIFLTNKSSNEDNIRRTAISQVTMQDNTSEIFKAFTVLARTTGGLTESGANAAYAFKKAVDASENYYLLYYRPSPYKADGRFKEIEVKVRNRDYKVTHRAGYLAD